MPEVLYRKWIKKTVIILKYRNFLKLDILWIFGHHWSLMALYDLFGLCGPWMAFNDFFRLREVFLSKNQVIMTTFHQSNIKNDHHTRFAKAVQSEMARVSSFRSDFLQNLYFSFHWYQLVSSSFLQPRLAGDQNYYSGKISGFV